MTTGQRRAPRAITVIDGITIYNAVAMFVLLLVAWANDSASYSGVHFQLGLIVVICLRSNFPSEADLTIPIPLRTLEAAFH